MADMCYPIYGAGIVSACIHIGGYIMDFKVGEHEGCKALYYDAGEEGEKIAEQGSLVAVSYEGSLSVHGILCSVKDDGIVVQDGAQEDAVHIKFGSISSFRVTAEPWAVGAVVDAAKRMDRVHGFSIVRSLVRKGVPVEG